ncbi:MAG: hypothetical protein QGH33_14070 [Pirellulaceae bacterium]|jgi:hypothetical protein|nr:hypothetical protein [Pirellulaceae bacterium]HJN11317.1 hypothetical protein [Pirellulaceae bacterium]
MHRRIHSGNKDSGKWKRIARTGVGNVTAEEYQGWKIELTHRKVGVTIRRDQFVVTMRRTTPAHEEQLTGFATKVAALAAARKRIDLLSAVRRPLSGAGRVHRARTSPNDD